MTQDPQTRRQLLQRTGGVVLTATGATTFAVTQSASAESNADGILSDGITADGGDTWAFIRGRLSIVPTRKPDTVESLADDMRNEFQANTEHWLEYGNWVLEETDYQPPEHTVVGVDVTITRGRWVRDQSGTVETTLEATYDSGSDEFTGLEWANGSPENPDYEVTLENMAAEHAGNELQEFRRKFIDTTGDGDHEHPDMEYASMLAGRYSSDVYVGGDSVLEVLLGEVDADVF